MLSALGDWLIFLYVGSVSLSQASGYEVSFYVLCGITFAALILTLFQRQSWTSLKDSIVTPLAK